MEVTPGAQVDSGPPASMIRYAGLFLAFHFCGALLVWTLIRVVGIPRPPLFGLWIMLGAGYMMSYIFVRRRRRIFTSSEKWKLICYCGVYLILFALYAYFSAHGKNYDGSIAAIGCLVDVAALILLFEFGASRLMRDYLQELV
jgi:hypothetical protein